MCDCRIICLNFLCKYLNFPSWDQLGKLWFIARFKQLYDKQWVLTEDSSAKTNRSAVQSLIIWIQNYSTFLYSAHLNNWNSGPHAFMRQRRSEYKVGCFFPIVICSAWCSVETTTIGKTHSTLVYRTLIKIGKVIVIFKTTYSFVVFSNRQTWMLPSKPLLVTLVTFLMSLSQFPLVNICSV